MLLTLGLLLLALVAVLAAPVSIRFQLARQNALHGEVHVRMLFGLVRLRSELPKSDTTGDHEPDASAAAKTDEKETLPRKHGSVLALIRQRPFRRRVIRFLGDIWHSVHPQDMFLRMRIGLGDPADTGLLWAVMGPVSALLSCVPRSSITLEPEFFDATFEFDSSGQVRFTPLRLLYHSTALAVSPAIWRGVRQLKGSGT